MSVQFKHFHLTDLAVDVLLSVGNVLVLLVDNDVVVAGTVAGGLDVLDLLSMK